MENLSQKIKDSSAKVCVIGLGYVGLPLAFEFAQAGFETIGLDVNSERVAMINKGQNYVQDINNDQFKALVETKKLHATTDASVLSTVDCISVCVPTPLGENKDPDISYIISSINNVAKNLKKGQVIVLESTTYPGTTEEIVLPLLEKSGLKVGSDFFLAFSPERIDPGNKNYGLKNTPKVIGGITSSCSEIARSLYQTIVDQVDLVSNTRTAEMVKLLENTFRAINIGLANEVALMCDVLNINVWEVIDAAKTKPFGFMPFYPGPGLGGHCIPIDSHYLSWKLRSHNFYSRFIEIASQISNKMPEYVVQKISKQMNEQKKCINGAKFLLLGMSYKKDIGDTRESPAIKVAEELAKLGAHIEYHDPYVSSVKISDRVFASVELTKDKVKAADCVVLLSDHTAFNYKSILEQAQAVFDTRNAFKTDDAKLWKI